MEPIISKDAIRNRASKAHAGGKGRDDHNMNWNAAATKEWQEEWDRCEVARLEQQHLVEA